MLTRLSKLNRRRNPLSLGFTMVEMMIALAAGMIILGAVVVASITLSHSLAAISNYVQLDADSRNTLDLMSRDIRNSSHNISISPTSISMVGTNIQGVPYSFSYTWDGSNVWRNYADTNGSFTTLMLSNCAYLSFSNFTRVPNAGFTFNLATGTNDTKMISVSWKCTRPILGQQLNTESVQTAKICVRN